jgi:hypothetical protein
MWSANVATSLSISEITVPVIYRTALSVQATVEQPGKITFFSNGKRIPGCVSRSITTTYICSYRPSVHGANIVTASLVPTDSGYARVTSAPKNLGAASRTTTR